MANTVDVVLAGITKSMLTTEVAGVVTPHHIVDIDNVDVTMLTAAAVTGTAQDWPGGPGLWSVWGVWDGATAQLQYSPDAGSTWINVDDAVLGLDGGFILSLPRDKIRTAIATAGTDTVLSSKMKKV